VKEMVVEFPVSKFTVIAECSQNAFVVLVME